MTKAEKFLAEYRRRGYPDERIKVIVSMRPEPLRTVVLKLLENNPNVKSSTASTTTARRKATVKAKAKTSRVKKMTSDEIQKRVKELQSNRTKLRSLVKKSAALGAENRSLKERLDEMEEYDGLHQQLQMIKAQKEAKEAEIEDLREKVDLLIDDAGDKIQTISELQSAASQLDEIMGERNRLREEVAEMCEAESKSAERIQELEQAWRSGQEELHEFRQELRGKVEELEAVRQGIKDEEETAGTIRTQYKQQSYDYKRTRDRELQLSRRKSDFYRKLSTAAGVTALLLLIVLVLPNRGPTPITDVGDSTIPESLHPVMLDRGLDDLADESMVEVSTGRDTTALSLELPLVDLTGDESQPPVQAPLAMEKGPRMTAPERPESRIITYIVKRGDKLSKICKEKLGDGSPETVKRVAAENNLSNPNKIYPGMKLKITIPAGE